MISNMLPPDITLSVNKVSKCYRLPVYHSADTMELKARLNHCLMRALHLTRPVEKMPLWACRDISFEMKRGEFVALMGGNGSGKSTLLRLINRTGRVSSGEIKVSGKMTSILTFNAGIFQTLTGEDNLRLDTLFHQWPIELFEEQWDEICAYAELQDYRAMPIKHYSTGMKARLSMAYALHMPCQLLLIDEVLMVADAAFQERALLRLKELQTSHQLSMLLVGHNTSFLRRFCDRAIVLHKGHLVFDGPFGEAEAFYKRMMTGWEPPIPSSEPLLV